MGIRGRAQAQIKQQFAHVIHQWLDREGLILEKPLGDQGSMGDLSILQRATGDCAHELFDQTGCVDMIDSSIGRPTFSFLRREPPGVLSNPLQYDTGLKLYPSLSFN
jgi:hypothetical protein